MCGRFNLTATIEEITEAFELRRLPRHEISYNISPGQKILAVVQLHDGSRKGVYLHWGLIPSWARERKIANHLINARAETIAEKPSFRAAFRKRRCLIPATGFYEWQAQENGKQPYHIHRQDNHLFAFAGLWEHWESRETTLYSCTIITTAANSLMQPVHARMPVILPQAAYSDWLQESNNETDLKKIIATPDYSGFSLTPISARINNPVNNDRQCLQPVSQGSGS